MSVQSLPTVNLAAGLDDDFDVLIVGLSSTAGEDRLVGVPDGVASTAGPLDDVARGLGATSKESSTTVVPLPGGRRVVIVGLGAGDATAEEARRADMARRAERARRAAGAGLRVAGGLPGDAPLRVAVSLGATAGTLQAVAEGALLGVYNYRPASGKPGVGAITVICDAAGDTAEAALSRGVTCGTVIDQARDWINTPPNLLYPESFAGLIGQAVEGTDIGVTVWDEAALQRDGFGGILAVGGGSARPPRLVELTYAPAGADKHLALIGKGVTFDSGGLNLKPGDSMDTMKSDMSGAASVVAATLAIAAARLPLRVTTYAALAENMPSGSAFRASDVMTMFGGRTVENSNSDAEGRIVMADAIAKACQANPDMVIDIATLTGACVVALGERVAGVMTRDDASAELVLSAAAAAGEPFWRLPIPEETRAKLDSDVADIKSTGDRPGGALTAAAFLAEFVPDGVAWAHLDIAGPAFNTHEPYHYVPKGATGAGIRTLIALAESMAG